MIVQNLKNILPEKCYLRCEEILNHFRLHVMDYDVRNTEDSINVQSESDITRTKIRGYLLALSDADIITEYTMMQAMEQYSTAITTIYELWLDEITF